MEFAHETVARRAWLNAELYLAS
eukprot:SAG31_NODE_16016_length_727_cov_1.087580_1_plen_22_part_10